MVIRYSSTTSVLDYHTIYIFSIWHTDDIQPTSEAPGEMPDYGETSWAKFVEIVNSYGTPAELGITLHKENLETAKSSDDGK